MKIKKLFQAVKNRVNQSSKVTNLKYDYKIDGVTQGSLSLFMQCREKANLFHQGYQSKSTSLGLTYGTIGHGVLERVYEDLRLGKLKSPPSKEQIKKYLFVIEQIWRKEYPKAGKTLIDQLEYSLAIVEATMPLYFEFWKKDFQDKSFEAIEKNFKIPYTLSDGRGTFIRGKQDGVFKFKKDPKSLWLFEHKFLSMINEGDLVDTLSMNFQVNVYLYALQQIYKKIPNGVLYNIVRRTCLRQNKKESISQFAKRVAKDIETRPDFYFIRMNITIEKEQRVKFESDLKALITDFINWQEYKVIHYRNPNQCIDKYGKCQYLPICAEKKFYLYDKRETMFRELEDL